MSRATFVAALACVALAVVACHDDSKPPAVPLPESTASGVASVSAPPVLAVPPAEIVIETTQITARGAKILDLPSDRSGGADPKDKRSGKNDLFLVPLAAAYPLDGGRIERSTTIDVDDTTPYRMLLEVLFTLGQWQECGEDPRRLAERLAGAKDRTTLLAEVDASLRQDSAPAEQRCRDMEAMAAHLRGLVAAGLDGGD